MIKYDIKIFEKQAEKETIRGLDLVQCDTISFILNRYKIDFIVKKVKNGEYI